MAITAFKDQPLLQGSGSRVTQTSEFLRELVLESCCLVMNFSGAANGTFLFVVLDQTIQFHEVVYNL